MTPDRDGGATLPYGGITRIRFQGSISPRGVRCIRATGTPNVSNYEGTLIELWDNCKPFYASSPVYLSHK